MSRRPCLKLSMSFRLFSECFFDKMVNCCVPGCTNYPGKSTNISYHKISKDPQQQKAWISRLRRENLLPLKNCYVCSKHFDNECFESDFMEQLISKKKKRKRLKADAIPSIFTFTLPTAVSNKRRATTELVSFAAVFWMSRNAPPKETAA